MGTLEKLLLHRVIMRCVDNIKMDLTDAADVSDSGSCPMAGFDTDNTECPSVNTLLV